MTDTDDTATDSPEETPAKTPASQGGGLDLSELKMVPDWVANFDSKPSPPKFRDSDRGPRRDGRGRHERGREGRGGPGRGGPPRGRQGDRDQRGQGGRPGGNRGRRDEDRGRDRDRRHGRRDGDRPQREWVDLPTDVDATIHPADASLDALAAHVKATGRSFSLFDVARLVLSKPSGYVVRFLCKEERKDPLYQVKADGALFLSQEEAVQHVLKSRALDQFYRAEDLEKEEPKGNFQNVAVCGMSGTLLGPPSHHSYRDAVLRLHRERFSNMPLETFKRRIRTETDEELIQKWKEEQKTARVWYPKTPGEDEAATEAAPSEAPDEPEAEAAPPTDENPEQTEAPPSESAAENTDSAEETADAENPESTADTTPESEPEASDPETPEAPAQPDAPKPDPLATMVEVERHFRAHHLADCLVETRDASLPGAIDKALISPAFFFQLRKAVEAARKNLFEMAQKLSAGFDRRGMKTFKRRGGKMFVSKVRPRAITDGVVFSDRVTSIVAEIKLSTQGLQVKDLLQKLTLAGATPPEVAVEKPALTAQPAATEVTDSADAAEAKPEKEEPKPDETLSPEQTALLQDLRWLVNEGYLIEYADGLVTLGVQGDPGVAKSKKPKAPKKKPAPQASKEENAAAVIAQEGPKPEPVEAAPKTVAPEASQESAPAASEPSPEPAEEPPAPAVAKEADAKPESQDPSASN